MHRPATNTRAPITTNASPKATPAAARVRPTASTIGAAVGRGTSTAAGPARATRLGGTCGSVAMGLIPLTKLLSAPHQVDDREHNHPNAVHEVPIPGNQRDGGRISGRHLACPGQTEHDHHDDYPSRHVRRMQTDQCV